MTPAGQWGVTPNNFDLIRVLASLQVALMHITDPGWFGIDTEALNLRRVLQFLPGVPIFFFISGVLVARACRATPLREYFRNRCLRIFPALWVALVLTLIPVLLNPQCSAPSTTGNWLAWWFTQMSAGQMWTPEFLSGCWQNALNGGRWTVAVELEFYLLLPLLILATRLRAAWWLLAAALAIVSLAFQFWLLARLAPGVATWMLIAQASLLPYLWIFLIGVAVQPHLASLARWFENRVHWWLVAYVLTVWLTRELGWRNAGAAINPASMLVLCGLTLSFAFSFRGLSDRLLRGNDLTYGLYLLHPIVMLVMVSLGLDDGWPFAALALLLSVLLAAASWMLVEKPFLGRKRQAAHPQR